MLNYSADSENKSYSYDEAWNIYNSIMNLLVKLDNKDFNYLFGSKFASKREMLKSLPEFIKISSRSISNDDKVSLSIF
ncbi:hypothetical protein [Mycoplasmopsis verecunda]|uniref:Uncharacterized protein n=1 Tax=Mycoplasmopsis verecunda TaxID=171291 RepID=A0A1T4LFV7_9BACT|nr:hypothetical protein [Mycoplasmopsis verecunda]WPB54851.1 hypothetical protein SAM46_01700 [Mycoplasmopsis verecunda]SJZ53609.1 hypothetical protein SAMN02745154_00440 [Mycoplasmopsis verecunda]